MFGLKLLMNCPLDREQKRLLKELKDYDIPYWVQRDYRQKVKNNLNDTYDVIKKKLIRNIVLGKKIREYNRYCVVQYGNLEIEVDKRAKQIYDIRNFKGHYYYGVDIKQKEWLEKYLKIE